ncbi:hypothetical protein K435DRAFT_807506 [Dendrothele bispora CBS 962.96]|uniref:Glucose-methanol-choline oxidoreductase C-terminal domain-containing protein n=1 Tax=Dendrothele bispora (strain CBS 962.96) TaxID=1314807 RepID=A0A4S8L4W0_DENBC|nr:hypothetical protein K435DRAFT_807506 [Dendrothele bispora CBS 962.96]
MLTRAPLVSIQVFKTTADWGYETTTLRPFSSPALNVLIFSYSVHPAMYLLKSEKYLPSPNHPKVKPEDRGRSMAYRPMLKLLLQSTVSPLRHTKTLGFHTTRTPQLLLLSGVGPAVEFKPLDILTFFSTCQPSEKHVNDHISLGSVIFPAKLGYTYDHMRSRPSQNFTLFKRLVFGTGPLSAQGATAAFVRSDDKSPPYGSNASAGVEVKDLTTGPGAPDIELYWPPSIFTNYGFTHIPAGLSGISMSLVALMPKREGSVTLTLNLNSVWDHPIIDPTSENDLNMIVRGVRLLLRLARIKASEVGFRSKNRTTAVDNLFFSGDADPDKVSFSKILVLEQIVLNAGFFLGDR